MRQIIVDIANPLFAIVVLIGFFIIFIGVVYWVCFRIPQRVHDRNARIPLEDLPVESKEGQSHE